MEKPSKVETTLWKKVKNAFKYRNKLSYIVSKSEIKSEIRECKERRIEIISSLFKKPVNKEIIEKEIVKDEKTLLSNLSTNKREEYEKLRKRETKFSENFLKKMESIRRILMKVPNKSFTSNANSSINEGFHSLHIQIHPKMHYTKKHYEGLMSISVLRNNFGRYESMKMVIDMFGVILSQSIERKLKSLDKKRKYQFEKRKENKHELNKHFKIIKMKKKRNEMIYSSLIKEKNKEKNKEKEKDKSIVETLNLETFLKKAKDNEKSVTVPEIDKYFDQFGLKKYKLKKKDKLNVLNYIEKQSLETYKSNFSEMVSKKNVKNINNTSKYKKKSQKTSTQRTTSAPEQINITQNISNNNINRFSENKFKELDENILVIENGENSICNENNVENFGENKEDDSLFEEMDKFEKENTDIIEMIENRTISKEYDQNLYFKTLELQVLTRNNFDSLIKFYSNHQDNLFKKENMINLLNSYFTNELNEVTFNFFIKEIISERNSTKNLEAFKKMNQFLFISSLQSDEEYKITISKFKESDIGLICVKKSSLGIHILKYDKNISVISSKNENISSLFKEIGLSKSKVSHFSVDSEETFPISLLYLIRVSLIDQNKSINKIFSDFKEENFFSIESEKEEIKNVIHEFFHQKIITILKSNNSFSSHNKGIVPFCFICQSFNYDKVKKKLNLI